MSNGTTMDRLVPVGADSQAIAAVMQSLAKVLEASLLANGHSEINVTFDPIEQLVKDDPADATCINLFLYQVNPNPSLLNQPLPEHNPRVQCSPIPLPLDLNFVATVHLGELAEFPSAHIALALLASTFHENAVLHPRLMEKKKLIYDYPHLENARISILPTSLDDLHKLWGALQVPAQMGLFFRVSPVYVATDVPVVSPARVLFRGPGDRGWDATPNVYGVFPVADEWEYAGVSEIEKQRHSPRQPIFEPNDPVRITGHNLAGPKGSTVRVVIGPDVDPADNLTLRVTKSTYGRIDFVSDLQTSNTSIPQIPGHYRIRIEQGQADSAAMPRRSAELPFMVAPRFAHHNLGSYKAGERIEVELRDALDEHAPNPANRARDTIELRFGGFNLPLRRQTAPKFKYEGELPKTIPQSQLGVFVARVCVNGVENLPIVVTTQGKQTLQPGPEIKLTQ
jgi:hypothetical protein